MQNKFYKNNTNDKIYWVDSDQIGEWLFTFDKKKIYNMYQDYPWKLTKEEKEIFDKENPFWKEYFKGRK